MNITRILFAARTFWNLYGRYKRSIILLIFLGTLDGFLGALGVTTLIPLFSLLTRQEASAGASRVSKIIEWSMSLLHMSVSIGPVLFFLFLIFLANACVLFFFKYIGLTIFSAYEVELRKNLYRSF